MPTPYANVHVDVTESIATLTIDRPDVKNALNRETVDECLDALSTRWRRATSVGVLIITGAGESSFVSGSDIGDIRTRDQRTMGLRRSHSSLFAAVERFPRPTIAAINGYALGGGCELALACDIRIASETAKFGQPELGLGIIPAAGGTQRLPRIVGLGWAKHLVLTGDIIDAKQALAIGLVTAAHARRPAAAARARAGQEDSPPGPAGRAPGQARPQRVRPRRSRFGPAHRDARTGDLLRLGRQARRDDGVPGEAQAEVHRPVMRRDCRPELSTGTVD